ncbi:MAG: OB-fold nucleic acid binding domain-containing protein [Candidatus Marinimicrobia bacterium]|jgi:3'-5' exoribonuclease|nr:OB-fold nucleic acid binding domain-containing protein [Candidatus Neomarinimicrobiota bacterium]MDP6853653.1 OB-fold nucleic acid binding domain-containing protein [Candidatus Neomarinimicrobiota bacterium]MDP6936136.1 OB-fold nucleic acid binding domain-containing protein [Candidatus Neomarinimicrobiota bacterium]
MKLTQIADFKIGRSVQGFYLCREKHIRHTRKGELYIDMALSDATGMVMGKMWDHVQEFSSKFKNGDPVAVKGKVTEYQDQLQLTITQINLADKKRYGKYGFAPEQLVEQIKESPEEIWQDLTAIIHSLASPYEELLMLIFTENKQQILQLPGSVNHHHPVQGGFLKHTVNTARLCEKILPIYPHLDYNLSMSGILLHDIGKIKSMTSDLISQHTDIGKLIGHIVLGRDILREAIKTIKKFPEGIALKLEHIILSHQGTREKGAVQTPLFPEALFVHYIDEMDGKMDLIQRAIQDDQNPVWTDSHNPFHRELFKK